MMLLLANMFLLAHVVVPHAHHNGIVCFSLSELLHQNECPDSHDDICDCSCDHGKESHHHHSLPDDCDLKDIVLRQDNDQHTEIVPCADCQTLLYCIYSLNDLYLLAPEYGQRFVEKPYVITYISPYVGTTFGLRAPPVSCFLA